MTSGLTKTAFKLCVTFNYNTQKMFDLSINGGNKYSLKASKTLKIIEVDRGQYLNFDELNLLKTWIDKFPEKDILIKYELDKFTTYTACNGLPFLSERIRIAYKFPYGPLPIAGELKKFKQISFAIKGTENTPMIYGDFNSSFAKLVGRLVTSTLSIK